MERSLEIDRSALADTAQPDILASILTAQVSAQVERLLPFPVEDAAKACGILEIRALQTDGFVGGLIQDAHKESGYILVKAGMRADRTRFTVAHELGHFVNLRHFAPEGSDKLLCTREDLVASGLSQTGRHGMEAQANEFAANLLMPAAALAKQSFMRGSAEISRILELQELCFVSKEAAARRYVELHGDDIAVVFSKDGTLLRMAKSRDFPWLGARAGQPLFPKALTRAFQGQEGDLSEQEEADTFHWLSSKDAPRWQLWEEVLVQADGYRMTLLTAEAADDD